MTTMRRVFEDYCAGNKAGMDGKHFAKLARDTSLLDSKLTTTEVDLTFSKIKDRSQRRITFDQFQDGLSILAKKKGVKINDITAILEKSNGRILYGTVAEPNKFHDDKSLYTGVYANGGPSNVDTDKISDISQLMDRSPADARGVKKDGIGAYNDWGGGFKKKQLELGLKRGESRSTTAASAPCEDKSELRQVFKYYCEAGKKVMDSARLAKLTRDCKLLDQELTATDVDLFFVKVKAREEKRISYEQFLIILSMFAAKKGVETREIEATVSKSQGPILYGTIAEPNKYHDDKNYYTGVHAFGGPSIIEDHKISDLSQLMDRTPADVRGVKEKTKAASAWSMIRGMVQDNSGGGQHVLRNAGLRMMSMRQLNAPGCAVAENNAELQRVYGDYCQGESGMRGSQFAQLVKDVRLVDGKNLTPLDVEFIFNKARHPSERRLSYQHFLEAVQLLSQKKQVHMEALVARLESAPGPPAELARTASSASSPKRQSALLSILNAGGGGDLTRSPRPRSKDTSKTAADVLNFWQKSTSEESVSGGGGSSELERRRAEVEAARRRVEEVERKVHARKQKEEEEERKKEARREEEERLDAQLEAMRLAELKEIEEAQQQQQQLPSHAEEEEEEEEEQREEEQREEVERMESPSPASQQEQEQKEEEEEEEKRGQSEEEEQQYEEDYEEPDQPTTRTPEARHGRRAASAASASASAAPQPEVAETVEGEQEETVEEEEQEEKEEEDHTQEPALSPALHTKPLSPALAHTHTHPRSPAAPPPALASPGPYKPSFGGSAGPRSGGPSVFRFKPSGSFKKPKEEGEEAKRTEAREEGKEEEEEEEEREAPRVSSSTPPRVEEAKEEAEKKEEEEEGEGLGALLAAHRLPREVMLALRAHGVRTAAQLRAMDQHDVDAMQAQPHNTLPPIQATRLANLLGSDWQRSTPGSPAKEREEEEELEAEELEDVKVGKEEKEEEKKGWQPSPEADVDVQEEELSYFEI